MCKRIRFVCFESIKRATVPNVYRILNSHLLHESYGLWRSKFENPAAARMSVFQLDREWVPCCKTAERPLTTQVVQGFPELGSPP